MAIFWYNTHFSSIYHLGCGTLAISFRISGRTLYIIYFTFRECQFEQDLDYSETRRQLSYRRKKEDMKKNLARLEKLQKIVQEKELAKKLSGERLKGAGSEALIPAMVSVNSPTNLDSCLKINILENVISKIDILPKHIRSRSKWRRMKLLVCICFMLGRRVRHKN